MGAVMHPSGTSEVPRRRWRGRLQLILILLVVVGPMMLATGMYKLQFWVPESRSYHGELIGNGQGRAELGSRPTRRAGNCWSAPLVTVTRTASNWCTWRARYRSALAATPPVPATRWPPGNR